MGTLAEIRETIRFLLEEYPDKQSGLSWLQQKLLQTVESLGVATPAMVVATVLRTKLVGDSWLFDMLREFVEVPKPLLRLVNKSKHGSKGREFRTSTIAISDIGHAVLAGRADHVALNGIDRWIGGVHLRGHYVRWRWDSMRDKIIKAGLRELR